MTAKLEILRAGPTLTIQDSGRPGYARFGLSAGGAMDPHALAEGTALLGNDANAAALEMAGIGGRFRVTGEPLWLALGGAPMQATLDDRPLPWRCSFRAEPGQVIGIGGTLTGVADAGTYGYLHVAGGFDTALEIGARGNHLRAGVGGIDGKALVAGQVLPVGTPSGVRQEALGAPVPDHLGRREIRVLWGPQSDRFHADTRERLLAETYSVSHRRDRMAMRLDIAGGEPLESLLSGLSDPAMVGDIQVTGDGVPAILMREHQPTGGYPRIATVISADLAAAAQLPSGAPFRFVLVTREEAIAALREWRRSIATLAERVSPVIRSPEQVGNLLAYNLIGGVVSAGDDSGDSP